MVAGHVLQGMTSCSRCHCKALRQPEMISRACSGGLQQKQTAQLADQVSVYPQHTKRLLNVHWQHVICMLPDASKTPHW